MNFIHKLRLKYNISGGRKMDDDFEKYQDADKLGEWIKNYVKVSESE